MTYTALVTGVGTAKYNYQSAFEGQSTTCVQGPDVRVVSYIIDSYTRLLDCYVRYGKFACE